MRQHLAPLWIGGKNVGALGALGAIMLIDVEHRVERSGGAAADMRFKIDVVAINILAEREGEAQDRRVAVAERKRFAECAEAVHQRSSTSSGVRARETQVMIASPLARSSGDRTWSRCSGKPDSTPMRH